MNDTNHPDNRLANPTDHKAPTSPLGDVHQEPARSKSSSSLSDAKLDLETGTTNPSIATDSAFTPKQNTASTSGILLVGRQSKGRYRLARSKNLALLPYEAAQLAASSSPPRRPYALRNLIPSRLAATVMMASFAICTLVWSMPDANILGPVADVPVVDINASTIDQFEPERVEEFQTSAIDGFFKPSPRPTLPISSRSIAESNQDGPSNPSPASPSFSAQKETAQKITPKTGSDDAKDKAIASLAIGGPPATLLAAAGTRSVRDSLKRSPSELPPNLSKSSQKSDDSLPRQSIFHVDSFGMGQDNIVLARPLHKPSLKPLDVAALVPKAKVPTSFRPAVKLRELRELSEQRPTKAAPLASLNSIDDDNPGTPLERLWGNLVQGVAGALRNRDTSFQMVLKADSNSDGSDKHQGAGNDHDHYDG